MDQPIFIMNHGWNGELYDMEDREEYIEVKDARHIRAVLRAEEEEKNKAQEESILKIIDDKQPTPVAQSPPSQIKPRFIQDDRERVKIQQKPAVYQEKKQTKQKEAKRNDPKPQYQQKQSSFRDNKPTNNNKSHAQYRQRSVEEAPKKIAYVEKYSGNEKSFKESKKKYVTKQGEMKRRRQAEVIKGEEIQLQLAGDDEHFDNEIYIGKRDVGIYFEKACEFIRDYDFIVLKSFAIYVSKAFMVAGLMAKEYPQLKQINVPSTVQVRITGKKGDRVETKGAVRIELSLQEDELNKKHIGYQESTRKVHNQKEGRFKPKEEGFKPKEEKYKPKEDRFKPKDDKPQYREKREEPKENVDKSRREDNRKYREKDFEDERGYR